MLMRVVVAVLITLLALLQVRLWVSGDGYRGVTQLAGQVLAQRDENGKLTERNRRLDAEVLDLKQGFSALEERARSDLGLIGPTESFFIYSDPPQDRPADADSRR